MPWISRVRRVAESILLDIAFGLRLCRKNRVVTASAVISLSLAIGACTAAFSLIDALILRPLPVSDPQGLVYVVAGAEPDDNSIFSYPLFERLRDAGRGQVQLFALGYQSRRDAVFDDSGGQLEKVYAQWISGTAFPLLGIKPALGRLLVGSDDLKPGQHPVAVLSYDFWSRRFGRDPSVLGRWVTLREKPLQIVGVAEKSFSGVEAGIMTDIWAPNMMGDAEALVSAGSTWLRIWGRLLPDVAVDQVRATAQAVFTNYQREQASRFAAVERPDIVERFINTPLFFRPAANGPSAVRNGFERPLWVLGIIATLVLLIACSNVASLLIARAAARDREMALRLSIGAGRGRLIQQMLIESAILSVASCLLGAIIAVQSAPLVAELLSTSQRVVRLDLRLDLRVLAFLTTAGSVTAFLFGLAPALRASAVSPNDALKSGSARQTTKIGLFRPLVAAQTAFGFIVLFVGGLLLTSFGKLLWSDVGFDRDNLVVVDVQARDRAQGGVQASSMWRQVLDRLEAIPEIQSASLSAWGLFQGLDAQQSVRVPGRDGYTIPPHTLPVSPGFFGTMRIRVLAGRDFDWRDVQPQSSAVIVNERFARQYFPGESALGKRFLTADKDATWIPQDIVGIAADAKYRSVRDAAPPTVYTPLPPVTSVAIQIRTRLEPAALGLRLRDELTGVHPAFRITGATLQSTLVDNTLVRERALALLSGFFSIVAIVLATVGLYGVLSYGVVQRTREIGIRVALGARPLAVVRLIVLETGVMTLVGIAMGLAGGIVASRPVVALLYEVQPSDAWSIAAPLTCFLLACSSAALRPAWRAARVDPTTALRDE